MATKFRPEFGQHMSDKTYFNACRLRDTLKRPTLKSDEKTVLQKTFNTLLLLNCKHADADRGFQERQHQREYSTQREKDRIFQENQRQQEQKCQQEQKRQMNFQEMQAIREQERAAWQTQSDALHNAFTTRRTPTYSGASTSRVRQENQHENTSLFPIIILIIMILYLYVTW